MIIYKVTINRVMDTPSVIYSSYTAPRNHIQDQYFQNRIDADKYVEDKYKAALELFGTQHGLEARISEITVL